MTFPIVFNTAVLVLNLVLYVLFCETVSLIAVGISSGCLVVCIAADAK